MENPETKKKGLKLKRMQPQQFEVEEVVDKIYDQKEKCNQYKVKWVGFPLAEATWEPASNLKKAPQKLREQNKKIAKKGVEDLKTQRPVDNLKEIERILPTKAIKQEKSRGDEKEKEKITETEKKREIQENTEEGEQKTKEKPSEKITEENEKIRTPEKVKEKKQEKAKSPEKIIEKSKETEKKVEEEKEKKQMKENKHEKVKEKHKEKHKKHKKSKESQAEIKVIDDNLYPLGDFKHGDRVKKILSAKPEGEQIKCLVEWMPRVSGFQPKISQVPNTELKDKKRYMLLLIEFYESKIKQGGKNKKDEQQGRNIEGNSQLIQEQITKEKDEKAGEKSHEPKIEKMNIEEAKASKEEEKEKQKVEIIEEKNNK